MNPTYDITKTYEWNYENGPIFLDKIPKRKPGKKIKLFDFEINSPLGVPAGPLLNSNWVKLYAELGFDIPIYKTVRTEYRAVHPAPNCVFVDTHGQLKAQQINTKLTKLENDPKSFEDITITNSFGVPSKEPKHWQADIEKANSYMGDGQIMIVSANGTPREGEDIAKDYARCAVMAKEAGAKIIEINYSCPNLVSKEGSIFTDPEVSSKISKQVKKELGNTPLIIKMGYFKDKALLAEVVKANAKYVDGIAGINTITMQVYNKKGEQALPGEGRLKSGLCGGGILDLSQEFTTDLAKLRKENNYDFIICGVGGITKPEDFDKRLAAGADIVMSATGAMWNPLLAMDWHNR